MDAPFEDLPPVAQKRIIALKAALAGSRPVVDKQPLIAKFLMRIQKQFPGSPFTGNPDAMDAWVVEQLRKDEAWIADMVSTLYDEGLETRKAALEAQLCSSIGKSLPADFKFSQVEKDSAWNRAYDSVQGQAKTFNGKIPGWIKKARADWVKQHGSLKGLNRYALLALTKKYIQDFDVWHDDLVSVSEFAYTWRDETAAFWMVNAGSAKVETQILPETASSIDIDTPIFCATFAGKWFPHDEAAALAYQHVNCPHHPAKSRVVEGALPLFLGIGYSRYNREELKDCK